MTGALELRFEILGEVQLQRRLEGVIGRLGDMRPALEKIAGDFHRTMEGAFASEGGSNAEGRWRELSPDYAKWKARHYPGKRILERTGALRASLAENKGKGAIERYEGNALTIGTSVTSARGYPYGVAHQQGRGRVPERKIIDLSDTVKRRWVKIMQDHIWIEE